MSLFEDAEYSLSDFRRASAKWTEIVKDFTREQLVQTMVDYRGLTEPAYEAANTELSQRDRNDLKRQLRREELDAWSGMTPTAIRKLAKRHHKSKKWVSNVLKYKAEKGVKMADGGRVLPDHDNAANDPLVRLTA